jgi:hypothetical protein
MPQKHLDNLMTRLHETFGSSEVSPQQQQILDSMRLQLNGNSLDKPSLQDSANLLLEELEMDHPKAAAILREIIETLGHIGV